MPIVGEPDLRSLCRLRRDIFSLGMTDLILPRSRIMAISLRICLSFGSNFASETVEKAKEGGLNERQQEGMQSLTDK